MKKKKLKALREMANKIKPLTHIVYSRIFGRDLIENNPDAKDKDGKPIQLDKYYKVPTIKTKSTYRKLKKIYVEGKIEFKKATV